MRSPAPRDRRSRRRRRRGRNKGRIAAVILIALLCAAALAGVFCFAGKRRAEAGREEAGAIRPERIPGDDTGTGLGGKASEAHTAAESGEKARERRLGSQEKAHRRRAALRRKRRQKRFWIL